MEPSIHHMNHGSLPLVFFPLDGFMVLFWSEKLTWVDAMAHLCGLQFSAIYKHIRYQYSYNN